MREQFLSRRGQRPEDHRAGAQGRVRQAPRRPHQVPPRRFRDAAVPRRRDRPGPPDPGSVPARAREDSRHQDARRGLRGPEGHRVLLEARDSGQGEADARAGQGRLGEGDDAALSDAGDRPRHTRRRGGGLPSVPFRRRVRPARTHLLDRAVPDPRRPAVADRLGSEIARVRGRRLPARSRRDVPAFRDARRLGDRRADVGGRRRQARLRQGHAANPDDPREKNARGAPERHLGLPLGQVSRAHRRRGAHARGPAGRLEDEPRCPDRHLGRRRALREGLPLRGRLDRVPERSARAASATRSRSSSARRSTHRSC